MIKKPIVILTTLLVATQIQAQGTTDETLKTLGQFKVTGDSEFTTIDQNSSSSDAIRNLLKNVSVPKGLEITLYALVPDARHMAVGPQGVATFVGTRKTEVWVVTDRDKDRVADENPFSWTGTVNSV